MAVPLNEVKKTNLFIKSSTNDFQDPVFLTFRLDFFPPPELYPKYDGLTNSALLRDPINQKNYDAKTGDLEQTLFKDNPNSLVELDTETWLSEYYYGIHQSMNPNPVKAIQTFKTRLREIQDSPWYIQSIQGIGDLWKSMHNIKKGHQKTTLVFNAIDSIKQPLTEMAEAYRHAIYDAERLSYRVPDNLRWFDMVIDLIEVRDIADYSGDFYVTENDGTISSGLRVIQFRCKMCEFDFSEYLGGSQSDHKISTEDKPFGASFKVNVGWVIQEPVSLTDARGFREMGMFSGALDSLNSKLSRFLTNATRLPGQLVGSVLNEIQTTIENKAMGNVYTGVDRFLTKMNNLSGNILGRTPSVGPPPLPVGKQNVYSHIRQSRPPEPNFDNVYPDIPETRDALKFDNIYDR